MNDEPKADLRRYLQAAREAVLWKLEGCSEYDIRRPCTPTGTNLLGLVKHLAGLEFGYFGMVFDREVADPPAWLTNYAAEEPDVDMWATPGESRAAVVGLYRRAWSHADATIEALPLDAIGEVPWWAEGRRRVTLHRILVHVATETHRHAGHADIVRELIDGAAGLSVANPNLPARDQVAWDEHVTRLERAARSAQG